MKEKRETRGPARDEILEYRLSAEHTHAQLNYPSPNKQTPAAAPHPYVTRTYGFFLTRGPYLRPLTWTLGQGSREPPQDTA